MIEHLEKSFDVSATTSVLTTWNFKELVESVRDSRAASITQQALYCELVDSEAVSDRILQLRSSEADPVPEVFYCAEISCVLWLEKFHVTYI